MLGWMVGLCLGMFVSALVGERLERRGLQCPAAYWWLGNLSALSSAAGYLLL